MNYRDFDNNGPSTLGRIIVVLVILATMGAVGMWIFRKQPQPEQVSAQPQPPSEPPKTKPVGKIIEIGFAGGSSKDRWLNWAMEKYNATPEGANVRLNKIPKGSMEGAQAILAGDTSIHVWSPASSLYKDVFVQEWTLKNNTDPLYKAEALSLSPMVFVMWEERYNEFVKKYGEVNFTTMSKALSEPGGWDAIAGKPDWGLFKLGHTNPNKSNSGLGALLLMAHEFYGKTTGLTNKDILDPKFQAFFASIERSVNSSTETTGTVMKDMVLRGPSSYDAICVYESVAMDYLKNAQGRWGNLHIIYPRRNLWNDYPYYVLNAPWVDKEHRDAAVKLVSFLLSEPIQREAIEHGYRPANANVPIIFDGSPFLKYKEYGLSVDVGQIVESPKAEVINTLLSSWQRVVANK
jgi:ABC-type Fe3+ transport system substrate-binding protein